MLILVFASARYACHRLDFCEISPRSRSWVLMAPQVFERVSENAGENFDKAVIFLMIVWHFLYSGAGSRNRGRSELLLLWADQIYGDMHWLWRPTEMSLVSFGSLKIEVDRQRFLPISLQQEVFDSEPKGSFGICWRLWLYGMLILFAWGSTSFAVAGSGCQTWSYSPNVRLVLRVSLLSHRRLPLVASYMICSSPLVGCNYCARSTI